MILNKTAHQNPSTEKPETNSAPSKIMSALITIKNKPRVRMVIGRVSKISNGFKSTFNNDSTIEISIAVKTLSTCTPGIRYAPITTANDIVTSLAKNGTPLFTTLMEYNLLKITNAKIHILK